MLYPAENELKEIADNRRDPCLVLDGTVNLDYAEEDQIPRVKGLLELLNQYFSSAE